jgi:NAD(P)-dependent dehydrogenase (short-subunit alcohol dehydrogenase family)
LVRETGNGRLEHAAADLATCDGVRALARQVLFNHRALHLLVNNVDGYFPTRAETTDGLERTFALNHLAPFLLTHLLMGPLRRGAPSRVVNVSARAHHNAALDFADLQNKRRYAASTAYGRAKLANLLFTYELARRLGGEAVTVNAVNPGLVAGDLVRKEKMLASAVARLAEKGLAKTAEEAGAAVAWVATAAELDGVSGKYVESGGAISSSPASYDEETARRLWELSEELAGLLPTERVAARPVAEVEGA